MEKRKKNKNQLNNLLQKQLQQQLKHHATEAAAEVKAFSVKTEDGKEFTLEVAADGATATLTDAEGKVTELKNAETASGERYADEAGNEIAMKGTEGVLTLGDLKEVPVTVEAK